MVKKRTVVLLCLIVGLITFVGGCFVGFFGGMIVANQLGTTDQAKADLARAMVKGAITTQVGVYQLHNNSYPARLDDLIVRPSSAPNWRGPYFNQLPVDPWGKPFQYKCPGIHNANTFDVYSTGPDGTAGTADDIGNWEKMQTASQ